MDGIGKYKGGATCASVVRELTKLTFDSVLCCGLGCLFEIIHRGGERRKESSIGIFNHSLFHAGAVFGSHLEKKFFKRLQVVIESPKFLLTLRLSLC